MLLNINATRAFILCFATVAMFTCDLYAGVVAQSVQFHNAVDTFCVMYSLIIHLGLTNTN